MDDLYYKVELAPDAELDLKDIYRYIRARSLSKRIAFRFVETIKAAISRNLSFMADGYRLIDNGALAAKGLRRLVIKEYLVFFTVNEETKAVTVARVIHGRRDWTGILRGAGDDET